mmetsp:Transcript_23185/g.72433  ORF Transcript_23185/g.72433 Transcript_23185/m.72433 type:complete len:309 (+) Transcript_23185:1291-2217(+)
MVNMQGVLRRALRSPLWSVGIIVLIIAIILIASSLRKLESTELGVRYDTINRRIFDDVFEEGLHPGPPFFRFLKLSSNFVTEPIVTTCYTKDGLEVNIDATIQYLPDRTKAALIIRTFKDSRTHGEMVYAAAHSALQHGCGDFTVAEWPKKRQEVQERQLQLMIQKLEEVYAIGIDVQLKNFELPTRFVAKVEEKEKARVDIELAQREQIQALTAAELELGRAVKQAEQASNNGQREADVITKEAELEAQAITYQFEKEAEIYKAIMDMQGLSTEGLLAYMMNRAIESSGNVDVVLSEPAQGTYREEL